MNKSLLTFTTFILCLICSADAQAFRDTILQNRAPAFVRLSYTSKFFSAPVFEVNSGMAKVDGKSRYSAGVTGELNFALHRISTRKTMWSVSTGASIINNVIDFSGSLNKDDFSLDNDVTWESRTSFANAEGFIALEMKSKIKDNMYFKIGYGRSAQSSYFQEYHMNTSILISRNGTIENLDLINTNFDIGALQSVDFNGMWRMGVEFDLKNGDSVHFLARMVNSSSDFVTREFVMSLGPEGTGTISKNYFGIDIGYSINYNFKKY